MKGAKRTAVVSGIKSAIISLPNWFKKKGRKMEGKRYETFFYMEKWCKRAVILLFCCSVILIIVTNLLYIMLQKHPGIIR